MYKYTQLIWKITIWDVLRQLQILIRGISSDNLITINDGIISIDSRDDSLNSDDELHINGGVLTLETDDDGINAENYLEINGGDITIVDCYEGIDCVETVVNGGTIHITASEDGFSASTDEILTTPSIVITGGYIYIESVSDGLDANGDLEISGGTIIINGPTHDFEGAIDFDDSFPLTGGTLIAVGEEGMAQYPDESSTQYSLAINLAGIDRDRTFSAGTLIHIETEDGTDILTFEPLKSYQSIVYSSALLSYGETYRVYTGGTYTDGTNVDGVYSDGTYSGGTLRCTVTMSSITTTYGDINYNIPPEDGGGDDPPPRP